MFILTLKFLWVRCLNIFFLTNFVLDYFFGKTLMSAKNFIAFFCCYFVGRGFLGCTYLFWFFQMFILLFFREFVWVETKTFLLKKKKKFTSFCYILFLLKRKKRLIPCVWVLFMTDMVWSGHQKVVLVL